MPSVAFPLSPRTERLAACLPGQQGGIVVAAAAVAVLMMSRSEERQEGRRRMKRAPRSRHVFCLPAASRDNRLRSSSGSNWLFCANEPFVFCGFQLIICPANRVLQRNNDGSRWRRWRRPARMSEEWWEECFLVAIRRGSQVSSVWSKGVKCRRVLRVEFGQEELVLVEESRDGVGKSIHAPRSISTIPGLQFFILFFFFFKEGIPFPPPHCKVVVSSTFFIVIFAATSPHRRLLLLTIVSSAAK